MKFHDPANFPKMSAAQRTIYGSVVTVTGTSGTADIVINGITNTTSVTFAGASLTTTATNWVTANYSYYHVRGYEVTSAAQVITVTPTWGWDTVNRIKATITNLTGDLSGTLTGVFEPDLNKAKTWQIVFGQSITIKRPKNMREGDKIRLELKSTGAYTTTFPTDSTAYYFPGGTENVQTSTSLDTVTGTCNLFMFPREDRVTLTGTSGTAYITAGGLKKLVTWAAGGGQDLTQTAADFVTSWVNSYAAIGLTLTSAATVITFKVTSDSQRDAANFFPVPVVLGAVTGNLSGTVVNVPAGRVVVDAAVKDIKQ